MFDSLTVASFNREGPLDSYMNVLFGVCMLCLRGLLCVSIVYLLHGIAGQVYHFSSLNSLP